MERGFDIYNARYRWLLLSQVKDLARAVLLLAQRHYQKDMAIDVAQARSNASQLLFDSIHMHTQPPQCLGQCRTTLIDRVSAHIHSMLLEADTLDDLKAALSNTYTFCSDMGVEVGIPAAKLGCAEVALPPFARPAVATAAVTDGDDYVQEQLHEGADAEACHGPPPTLLPKAVHVPGICHIIHNASADMDKAMAGYTAFVDQLKVFHAFMSSQRSRERFVEVVLKGSDFTVLAKTS